MSTRETILAAVVTTLSGLAGGRVYRSRGEQLPTLPAIVIAPVSEAASELVLTKADRQLSVSITIYAKGDTPDSAADTILSAAWAALFAAPDLGLGSDVQLLPDHNVQWQFENYDEAEVGLFVTFSYRTAIGSM